MFELHNMSAIYIIGFIQAVFIASLFLIKRKKLASDYVLSTYLLVMGFFLFFIYAKESGFYKSNPLTIILDILYWVLIGPSLIIYIDLITSVKQKFKTRYLLHLLPAIIVLIGFNGYFLEADTKYFEDYHSNWWFTTFATYVWYYNSPIYYIIGIVKLIRHKKKIKDNYSSTYKRDLKWLFYLVNGFAAFLFFGLITAHLKYYFNVNFPFDSSHYTWLVMVIYIFGIGYYGYIQKGVFSNINIVIEEHNPYLGREKGEKSRYQKSGLTKQESLSINKMLFNCMQKEKPYLDAELNLVTLAEMVNTTPHKLSQVINNENGLNFYDFVNRYRIDEVKEMLGKPEFDNTKILAIAWDCGFNSKSVFYNTFKKYTNQTPTQFKNSILQVNSV